MKLGMVRAGLGKPYSAATQPLLSMLGSAKRTGEGRGAQRLRVLQS